VLWNRIRRIRIFLALMNQNPVPFVSGTDLDPYIIKQKYVRKTLIPTVLRLLYDFFYLR
jgi:hypothetical protein